MSLGHGENCRGYEHKDDVPGPNVVGGGGSAKNTGELLRSPSLPLKKYFCNFMIAYFFPYMLL